MNLIASTWFFGLILPQKASHLPGKREPGQYLIEIKVWPKNRKNHFGCGCKNRNYQISDRICSKHFVIVFLMLPCVRQKMAFITSLWDNIQGASTHKTTTPTKMYPILFSYQSKCLPTMATISLTIANGIISFYMSSVLTELVEKKGRYKPQSLVVRE